MTNLLKRVFCSECGTLRICHGRSPHAVCPNGHGKLVPRFTVAQRRQAIAARLPLAQKIGRNTFLLAGRQGQFSYRDGSGRRRVEADAKVQADEVVGRHVTGHRTLVRVFARSTDD